MSEWGERDVKCEKCGTEMGIIRTYLSFKGDDSPERETEAYRHIIVGCRNGRCPEHGKEIEASRKKLEG